MTKLLSALVASSLFSTALAQAPRFATPSVPVGESCAPVTAQQVAKGFEGFAACASEAWATDNLTNGMKISHKVTDGYLVVEVSAPTSGWVGFGLGSMPDADMVIGMVDDATGAVRVNDYFTSGRRFPVLDTEGGGTDDILFASGTQTQGVTTIRFVRSLAAKGETDKDVTPGLQQRVIFAYGATDELRRHPGGATAAYNFTFVP